MADPIQYFTLTDHFEKPRVYALLRKQGGQLDRWSPDRSEWKHAPWHWDQFYGMADIGELEEVSAEQIAELIKKNLPANDIADADWEALSNERGSED